MPTQPKWAMGRSGGEAMVGLGAICLFVLVIARSIVALMVACFLALSAGTAFGGQHTAIRLRAGG